VAARYGGEELALVLPGAPLSAATAVAEGVRRAVRELALPHGGSPVAPVITVSIGVACAVGPAASPGALIDAADAALYRAKDLGRDRVEVAPEPRPQGTP